jgi:hypothetical protein
MPDYRALTRQIASEEGLDPNLFERQIEAESSFSPDVIDCSRSSSAGARGIAQLMPVHWARVDPCDPPAALRYAARWMVQLIDRYGGNTARALAAYNWGPGNVDGYTKPDGTRVPRWNGDPETLPAETRSYLGKILGSDASNGHHPDTPPIPPRVLKDLRPEVIRRAKKFIGGPYVWGGKSPTTGFDCSGFVAWQYNQLGLTIRSYTDHIYDDTIPCSDPGPGDIVLYEYPSDQPSRFPHVGFYIDEQQTLDSRGGSGVNFHPHVIGARRYYRRVRGVLDGQPPTSFPHPPAERLIPYIAHMGDAVADAIELSRASLDDGIERPSADMSAEDLRRNLAQAWKNIDRVYSEFGKEKAELRRNRVEAIGPPPAKTWV